MFFSLENFVYQHDIESRDQEIHFYFWFITETNNSIVFMLVFQRFQYGSPFFVDKKGTQILHAVQKYVKATTVPNVMTYIVY